MEIWKDIKDFEGLYQVSTYGRIKSCERRGTLGGVLIPFDNKGYDRVILTKNGKGKKYLVHRLVLETFEDNPLGLTQVNHKDENKKNNRLENLEWCTRKYNCNYGTRTQRQRKAMTNHPLMSKCVYQYTLDGSFVRSYPSLQEAERQTGIYHGHISKAASGKLHTTGGYVWSYKAPRSLF